MNTQTKLQLDERLIEGAITPEEYLATITAAAQAAVSSTRRERGNATKNSHRGLKPWQLGLLIPVILLVSSMLAEQPPMPTGYTASVPAQPVPSPSPEQKTLRDYYAPSGVSSSLFSMPDPKTMARGANPGQGSQPQISPEDAYAMGIAMAPLLQMQQEKLAQQQEAARQQQEANQRRKQQEAQQALEYAQRMQSMGVPHWARPQTGQQQTAPSNIHPAPTGGPYTFTCDRCGLIQNYSLQPAVMPRCPRDNGSMRLRR
ncbi:hypothetical protein [Prosthecobacter vanneervenii]|uniref:Uncharacterized protein n=1 Tax=Prosthecobacter vanneervenii TaxID=48466 RepID=A0A7W7Y6S4_9BACT|nr:hypothetical protein [Prosthecobacter vanneervenii]MBB5030522.1 hypothetical protein [Prosthecobacter vanneervenii]